MTGPARIARATIRDGDCEGPREAPRAPTFARALAHHWPNAVQWLHECCHSHRRAATHRQRAHASNRAPDEL